MMTWLQHHMKSRLSKILCLVVLAMVVTTSLLTTVVLRVHAAPSDVPGDWSTYLHDIQRSGATSDTTISNANATQLVKRWAFKTGDIIASSPTVVGGVVYVGSWDGYEYALDANTGTQKWKTFLGITYAAQICNPPTLGVSSAATVQNGIVYLGGGDAYWYALDANTGSVLWKVYTGDNSAAGGHYNWSSPLIYNGFAYIGIASEGDCPLVQGLLMKVDLNTHQVVGTAKMVPDGQVGGGVWTTPSIDTDTNTIYLTTGTENLTNQTYAQAFVAVDANTMAIKDSWKVPLSDTVLDSDFSTSATLFTDAQGNKLVSAINKNGYLYAFKRDNLAAGPIWKKLVAVGGDCPVPCGQSSVSSSAFANGTLFVAGEDTIINGVGYQGSVRAVDPATGTFKWEHGTVGPVIGAITYMNGLIIDGAGATVEVLDASTGTRLWSYKTGGWLYASPSVSNGQIFTGGVDGNVYAFGLPDRLPPPPPDDPNCPNAWTCQDVGGATPAGSENTPDSVTWTVQAGGAGSKGNSDQFRLMTQNFVGDIQLNATITSQDVATSQSGITIRQSNDPGSPNYSVFYTKGTGVVVQYRTTPGGTTTTNVQLPNATLPIYLMIQRVRDQFQAATSTDGYNYTLLPGTTVSMGMPNAVMGGLAASSGTNGTTANLGFDAVNFDVPNVPLTPPASPSPCPSGWSCQDVGNPLLIGDQSLTDGGVWTLQGAGTGIGSYIGAYSDQFHFVWQSIAADGMMTARVASQDNTSAQAKAGVMLRSNTDANSPYYAAFVTPGQGITIQYRPYQGGNAQLKLNKNGAVPVYLRVARSGNDFSTYMSNDGVSWSYVLQSSITLNLNGTMLAGLAVSSNVATTSGKATFDNVAISNTAPPPPTACPTGWNCADIGYPTPIGSQYVNGNVWTLLANGSDIWNTTDQFRYGWQLQTGDGSVSTRVVSQDNTNEWAKAGVMIRQSADGDAVNYAVLVTPSHGIQVQYRPTKGAVSISAASVPTGKVPVYLKVSHVGNTYSAYTSNDGTNWSIIPGSSTTVNMTGTLLAGIAATSHNTTDLGAVVFDSITFGGAVTTCPSGWSCGDIGNATPIGDQALNGNTWTMYAGGGDIWGTSDQFHYVWKQQTGDVGVSMHITSQTNTNVWAKAGPIIRQDTSADAAYYGVVVTPSNGIQVQYRATKGGTSMSAGSIAGTVPTYLQVARVGNAFTAYTSNDGTNWTAIAGSTVSITMTDPVLAGVAATSHDTTKLSTVVFDTVTIGSPTVSQPPASCPNGWSCGDVGNATPTGTQSVNGTTWTVQAGGGDIWGNSDQFRYISQAKTGDIGVSAHFTSQTNTNVWAKAGVMIRQDTSADAAYYGVVVTPGNGIQVQYRATKGGTSLSAGNVASGKVPTYLKVARIGNSFTAYTSTDGTNWTAIAGSTVTITMTANEAVGVAVTSHDTSKLSTAVCDTVNVG